MKDSYNKLLFHMVMAKIYADDIYKKLWDIKQYDDSIMFKKIRDSINQNRETFQTYLNESKEDSQ